MLLEKVSWVSHGGKQIFSIDVHPDGTRFVTSGGDFKIKIWRMDALKSVRKIVEKDNQSNNGNSNGYDPATKAHADGSNEKTEQQRSDGQLISTLSVHTNGVNCVRFSPDGLLLAGASDDCSVSVHKVNHGISNIETWTTRKIFRDHSKDVLGVEWFNDSRKLASCSVDNTVIVYDITANQRLTKFEGHNGFVKGISYDPIGRYLVSQSERALIVWNTDTWSKEAEITEPFKKQAGDTLFLRPGWSPDGAYIIAVNGTRSKSNIAPMIRRSDWSIAFELSGHKGTICAAKFNPVIFIDPANPDNVDEVVSYFALGSADKLLTIWSTKQKKPIARTANLFDDPIVDISWSKDGYSLLCVSSKGETVYLNFTVEELGKAIPMEQLRERLISLYGHSTIFGHSTSMGSGPQLLEAPIHNLPENATALRPAHPPPSAAPQTPLSARLQQNMVETSVATAKTQQLQSQSADKSQTATTISSAKEKQIEQRTSSGKRRITPQLVAGVDNSLPPASNVHPMLAWSSVSSSLGPVPSTTSFTLSVPTEQITPSITTPSTSTNNLVTPQKAQPQQKPQALPDVEETPKPDKKRKNRPQDAGNVQKKAAPSTSPGAPQRIASPSSSSAVTTTYAAMPKELYKRINKNESVECTANGTVKFMANGIVKWTTSIGNDSAVNLITANSMFVAVAASPNTVHVFSKSGRRLFPPFATDAEAKFLKCNSRSHLLLMTTDYTLYVWDVQQEECTLTCSLDQFCKNKNDDIDSVDVTDNGVPVIIISSGRSYIYHKSMKVWQCVADPRLPLSPFLSVANSAVQDAGSNHQITVAGLRRKAAEKVPLLEMLEVQPQRQTLQAVEDLEIAIAAAATMESRTEYMRFVESYVKLLTNTGDVSRLRDLCDSLMGPTYVTSSSGGWSPFVAGISKRVLLQQLLPIIESNRSLQRLAMEYRQSLAELLTSNTNSNSSSNSNGSL